MTTIDWQPSASLELIKARADLLAKIRNFFHKREIMEVETPICSRYANTDPSIESFTTLYTGPGAPSGLPLYLHTSPEFPMKRLLAAGSGPIYQICKVFRNGEAGRLHNPEFSMLEWYRPGFNHHHLMAEVAELVNSLLPEPRPVISMSYAEAFKKWLDIDPHNASKEALKRCAIKSGIESAHHLDIQNRDGWLDLLLSHIIEPKLGKKSLFFLYDYPASQASLAKIREGKPPIAERFELYMDGMELANGFHELTHADSQRERFEKDLDQRKTAGLPSPPMDEALLAGLASGMPDCAGIAVGIDRLLMIISSAQQIEETLCFAIDRA
ncbi:MAG: EF-P lysine aminoacylase GenX [Candidatus Polarisedimenticolaceae bacterium]|nr:EF-P lysine aminoacylase GenX [Candidatus Polarisedimenticolaceae bacterium]